MVAYFTHCSAIYLLALFIFYLTLYIPVYYSTTSFVLTGLHVWIHPNLTTLILMDIVVGCDNLLVQK